MGRILAKASPNVNHFEYGQIPSLKGDPKTAYLGDWWTYVFDKGPVVAVDLYHVEYPPPGHHRNHSWELPRAEFEAFIVELGHLVLLNAVPDDWHREYEVLYSQP